MTWGPRLSRILIVTHAFVVLGPIVLLAYWFLSFTIFAMSWLSSNSLSPKRLFCHSMVMSPNRLSVHRSNCSNLVIFPCTSYSMLIYQYFIGLLKSSIAARLDCCSKIDLWCDHVTAVMALYMLERLFIEQCVIFKLFLFTSFKQAGWRSSYLSEQVTSASSLASNSQHCSASSLSYE